MAGAERLSAAPGVGDGVQEEQSVIGSMLIDEKVVGLVVSELTEDDFTLPADKVLFRSFRKKHLAGEVIDPTTVLADAAPGDRDMVRYARELMLYITPTAANISEYIRLTREKTQRRKIHSIGLSLAALEQPQDAISLLKQGMDLLSQEGQDDEADAAKFMTEFMEDLDRKPTYLPWGFPFLDSDLYVERGDFVVLAGRPSDGKTALALHMAYEQAKTLKVGFFSLETRRLKLSTRLAASVSGIPLKKIKSRKLTTNERFLLARCANDISKRKLSFINSMNWTAERIEARTLARKYDVIYVDYLQLVSASVRRSDRTPEVADISRSLANMARRHNITVVALAQLSRPENKTKRRAPVLADLKESGQIEQDADAVMIIWRQSETSSKTKRFLTLAKNKEGMLADWDLVFRGETQRFIPELSGHNPPKRDPEPDHQSQFTELTSDDPNMPF